MWVSSPNYIFGQGTLITQTVSDLITSTHPDMVSVSQTADRKRKTQKKTGVDPKPRVTLLQLSMRRSDM